MVESFLDFVCRVIETQGVVSGLLLVMIVQQWGMQRELLVKICTLEEFIMKCLETEMTVNHSRS